jgi:hypothetical protein
LTQALRLLATALLSAFLVLFAVIPAAAHGGGLNDCGCHWDHSNDTCHCHDDGGCNYCTEDKEGSGGGGGVDCSIVSGATASGLPVVLVGIILLRLRRRGTS